VVSNPFGASQVAVWLLAIATLLQQYAVYNDLHEMEGNQKVAGAEYRNWLERSPERFIRFWIMVALLFGVGKIADQIYPLLQYDIGFVGARTTLSAILRPIDSNTNLAHNLFVIGSVAVFFLLAGWNLCALIIRLRSRPTNHQTLKDFVGEWLITSRIAIFTFLSIICFFYWLFVFDSSPYLSNWALAWVLIYLLLVLFILALRYEWSFALVERLLVGLCEVAIKIGSPSSTKTDVSQITQNKKAE
jgi:hypothetical protein